MPELGYFYIHGPGALEYSQFCDNRTCDVLGYLAKKSLIQSRAFGMHIGSAQLNYPGSLMLGGYDRGRAIAPVIEANQLQLLDIIISVETGASHFPFGSVSSLLKTENGTAVEPNNIELSPDEPYIFLPQQAIDAVTSKPPVYFDTISRYHIWNTTDPLYSTITTSPSYLGFVFPTAPGSTTNTTIKIPFILLNLTLETSISGLPANVPYFPVQAMSLTEFQSSYILGRAFLQAVYASANHHLNLSWLAQAP